MAAHTRAGSHQSRDLTVVEQQAQQLLESVARFRIKFLSLMNNALSRGHLNLPQYTALSVVVLSGPLAMGQLTQGLRVSTAAATNVVDKLVQMRMVARRRHERDRRVVLVEATTRGRRTVERVQQGVGEVLAGLLAQLSPRERRQLVAVHERLTELAWELPSEGKR